MSIIDCRKSDADTAGPPTSPTAREFRDTVGLFATGVTVVTAQGRGEVRGMTANAFTAVSLDPLLLLVCLRLGSPTDELISRVPHFAVSILSADQSSVATWFANPDRPAGTAQLDAVGWRPGRMTGTPLVAGAMAWLECAVQERVVVGDHAVVYGRVLDLGRAGHTRALVFHGGSFGALGEMPVELAAS